MKYYSLIFLGLLVFSATAFAQSKPQDRIEISTNPPPPAMSLPVVKEVGKAKATYNERTDKTAAQTVPFQVVGEWSNGVRLKAGFESTGKKITKPSVIKLTFYSSSENRVLADNRAITILLDGNTVLSDTARYEGGNTNGRIFLITVAQEIPYDLFLKMLTAKKVHMKIGPADFDLKDADLEALKDLKKLIEQAE